MSHKQKNPEEEHPIEQIEQAPITVDVNRLREGTRVIIENTGTRVEEIAGPQMQQVDSFANVQSKTAEALTPTPRPKKPEAAAPVEQVEEEVEERSEKTKKKHKKKKKKSKEKKRGDKEVLGDVKKALSENLSSPQKAALVGASVAGLPALYYGTGLSTIGLGGALTGLGALSLPLIGYYEGKKNKMGPQGALVGAASGAGLYALAGGTLSSLGTAVGSVGLPLGLAYAGYKIGKQNKKPVVGTLVGAGSGILAAPVVSGALATAAQTGWSWSVLGGALSASASTFGIAGAAAAGAVGVYYATKKGMQWYADRKNRKQQEVTVPAESNTTPPPPPPPPEATVESTDLPKYPPQPASRAQRPTQSSEGVFNQAA